MQTFIIGRDASNHIVLNDKLVSRQHAKLTISDIGQVAIKDLGSSNGTFVNGNRITESVLKSGDIVKCGSVFLEWGKYVNGTAQTVQQMNSQQYSYDQSVPQGSTAVISISQFNLKDVFKYLATRIFEIGDLFKTNWDRTASIWILKALPVLVILIASFIAYTRMNAIKFYFSPTVLALFVFTICPFITTYLFSFNKKVTIDKIALASGIFGFMQFGFLMFYTVSSWLFFRHGSIKLNYFRGVGFDLFSILIMLIGIVFLVNLIIAFCTFIYKYFISIGYNRSISIYLIITTVALNLLFQLLSAYVIYLVVNDNMPGYIF